MMMHSLTVLENEAQQEKDCGGHGREKERRRRELSQHQEPPDQRDLLGAEKVAEKAAQRRHHREPGVLHGPGGKGKEQAPMHVKMVFAQDNQDQL